MGPEKLVHILAIIKIKIMIIKAIYRLISIYPQHRIYYTLVMAHQYSLLDTQNLVHFHMLHNNQ
jgi:hypothetical protein